MYQKIKKILLFLFVILGFGFGGYKLSQYVKTAITHSTVVEEQLQNTDTVVVKKAQQEDYFAQKKYYGIIDRDNIKIIATSSSLIKKCMHNNNNHVYKKGEIVCEFDHERYIHEYNRAKIEHEFYKKQRETMTTLVAKGAVSQNQLDEMKCKEQVYGEEMLKYQCEINNNVIKAPFDCFLYEKTPLQPGTFVTHGQELMTLYDVKKIVLELRITKSDYEFISNSTPTIICNDEQIEGKIVSLAPKVQPTSNVIQMRVEFEHELLQNFIVGTPIEVTFTSKNSEKVIILPEEAIKQSGVNDYVFIVRNNMVHKVKVTVDKTYASDGNVRVHGIQNNEIVVIEGIQKLRDFQPVKPIFEDVINNKMESSNS